MRLWLSEDERRPDPAPARADARKALLAGTAGWIVVLVVSLVARGPLGAAGLGWITTAAWIGVGIGVVGLAVVRFRRRGDGGRVPERRPSSQGGGQSSSD